jgi:hypothetical protein
LRSNAAQGPAYIDFKHWTPLWQDGYGAFTVNAPGLEAAQHYVLRQEEHHRKQTFQEEYLEFLKRGLVEFDERYLW